MARPVHKFRRSARPRTQVRETCLIQTGPFSDWLNPANQPIAAASPTTTTTGGRQYRQPRREPGAPGQPRVASTSAQNKPTDNIVTRIRNGERLPLPWELDMKISDIEWVVLHNLGKKYPEAYKYIMLKALHHAGDLDPLHKAFPVQFPRGSEGLDDDDDNDDATPAPEPPCKN